MDFRGLPRFSKGFIVVSPLGAIGRCEASRGGINNEQAMVSKLRDLGYWVSLQIELDGDGVLCAKLARPLIFSKSTVVIAHRWKDLQCTPDDIKSLSVCWCRLLWVSSERARLCSEPGLLSLVYKVEKPLARPSGGKRRTTARHPGQRRCEKRPRGGGPSAPSRRTRRRSPSGPSPGRPGQDHLDDPGDCTGSDGDVEAGTDDELEGLLDDHHDKGLDSDDDIYEALVETLGLVESRKEAELDGPPEPERPPGPGADGDAFELARLNFATWHTAFEATYDAFQHRRNAFDHMWTWTTAAGDVVLSSRASMAVALVEKDGVCDQYMFADKGPPPSNVATDVTFNIFNHTMASGWGYRLRLDFLFRYQYPGGIMYDPKVNMGGTTVVHPNIGMIMIKGGPSTRPFAPDHIQRLKRVWNCAAVRPVVVLQPTCFACYSSDGALQTCPFCLLTSHARCVDGLDHRSKPRLNPIDDNIYLPARFGAHNCCVLCAVSLNV